MGKWQLESFIISKRISFGKESNKYFSRIEFKEGQNGFEFKLTDEQTKQMMLIISDTVVSCASELGENIAKSVGDYVAKNTNKRL